MKSVKFWDPAKEYKAIKPEIDAAMQHVLGRGDLILRKDVDEFERDFAMLVGTKYAVALATGTDALFLSIKTLASPGDDVVVSAYTFRATIEAILHADCNPVLVDIDDNWRDHITPNTSLAIPCHLEGKITEWEPHERIPMIEDACQALGAGPVKGKAACYSFYPAKILGCYGDGGAIATNDKAFADEIRLLRNHYKGDWSKPAYNSRLDNIQAAVLNVKLQHIPQALMRRKQIAMMYDEGLKRYAILPKPRNIYQDYIIGTGQPEALQLFLEECGIQTMRNFYPFPNNIPKPPGAASYEKHSLRLPCNPVLTDEEVYYVIERIKAFYAHW